MRGRGIDFQHRFNTSRWAEDLLINSLTEKHGLVTVRFGISAVVPEGEELIYGQTEFKEPDLLVFSAKSLSSKEAAFLEKGELSWTERQAFDKTISLEGLLKKALVAIEVEFSPYKASEMKGRNWQPRTLDQWARRPLKHAVPPTAPNIWVKEEDVGKLLAWQKRFGIPIVVAHLFDQEAFAVTMTELETFRKFLRENPGKRVQMQVTSGIFAKEQRYDRVDASGAAEVKPVFIITPAIATKVGTIEGVKVNAQLGISSSMKYVSHVIFSGGRLDVDTAFVALVTSLRSNG